MPEFNVRAESVNVQQIMEQIRARIREKRGVDYTEQEIRELAAVKLEKFLDPNGVRSDLLDQFRRTPPSPRAPSEELPEYEFGGETLYETHRGALRWARRMLQPILKLFFNPNPLIMALHKQSRINAMLRDAEDRREVFQQDMRDLQYEVLHNLVVELTRLGIEVKNLKMRVESLTSRLEFNERRARALESVVVYSEPLEEARGTEAVAPVVPERPGRDREPGAERATGPAQNGAPGEGPGQRSRRRRRRRGRRGGSSAGPAAPETRPGSEPGAAPFDADASRADSGAAEDDDLDQGEVRSETFGQTVSPPSHPAEPTTTPAAPSSSTANDERPQTTSSPSGFPDES
jgi:hypothetical protein